MVFRLFKMEIKIMDFKHKTYHRNLLERLLKKHAHLITEGILDVGSKNRRYDSWFNGHITAIDLQPNPQDNILAGDIEKGLNFEDQSFESIICLEVFEYLEKGSFVFQCRPKVIILCKHNLVVEVFFVDDCRL